MMHITQIASVPHTGTHFLKAFLEPFHNNTVETPQLRKNEAKFSRRYDDGPRGLNPTTSNLVWGHFTPRNMNQIESISQWFTTIIPLRDPLAALVTREHRHPEKTHEHILDAFNLMIDFHAQNDGAFAVPVDLLHNEPSRASWLRMVLSNAGLSSHQLAVEMTGKWAAAWPKSQHNSRGRYEQKKVYERGAMDQLVGIQGEIEVLQEMENKFRPFLEARGYADLAWFSSPTEKKHV